MRFMRLNFKLRLALRFGSLFSILFFLGTVFPESAFSQNKIVQGKVVEEGTNEPLAGASVQIRGTSVSTMTDEKGEFQLVMNSDKGILVISYTGKQTVE